MDINGWTAKDWAMRANTSPTTITRFLGQKKFTPSGRTLNKLANAANSAPPIGKFEYQNAYQVPMMRIVDVETQKLLQDGNIVSSLQLGANAFGVKIDNDSMTLGGILPNDMLVCEPAIKSKLQTNNIIAYYDKGVSAGRYFPPYIMPASSNASHKPVDFDSVWVIGRVVQQIRNL